MEVFTESGDTLTGALRETITPVSRLTPDMEAIDAETGTAPLTAFESNTDGITPDPKDTDTTGEYEDPWQEGFSVFDGTIFNSTDENTNQQKLEDFQ